MNPKLDFLGVNSTEGEVAAYLRGEGRLDPGALRPYQDRDDGRSYVSIYVGGPRDSIDSYRLTRIQTNATLRRDEWKSLDDAVLGISRNRLRGIQDLIDRGLTYDLGNAMGTTVLEWHDVSDSMEADLTMDGITRSKGDRPSYGTNYLPIPIIHVDYEINARVLAASRNMGNPLDTTGAEHASRKVAEKLESMLFTNTTYAFGGGTIYSYLNHPNRNEVTLSTNWDDSSKTGANIVDEVRDLKQASIDAKHFGPWVLYIPTSYETVLDDDYDATTPGTTTRERILKIDGIDDVKVIDTLADDNVLLVQMTPDVVRLVRGMGITNVEWKSEGQFVTNYKVMTIQVPQIRADQDGNSGIVHLA